MRPDWLAALCALPQPPAAAILLCISATQGSSPRAAGAAMLIGPDFAFDTIGGGQLEWQAMQQARQMLAQGTHSETAKISLGPSLGQCCGGVVHLLWRRLGQAELHALRALGASGARGSMALYLEDAPHCRLALWQAEQLCYADADAQEAAQQNARASLRIALGAPAAHVLIYGAGHVGAALLQALLPLPCRVTWADSRADAFAHLPPHLQAAPDVHYLDEYSPAALAAWLKQSGHEKPDALLIMSHNHQLDLELCALTLAQEDSRPAFLGLIGSASKATRFTRRLQQRGIAPAQLARLRCPIGLPGLHAKHPAIIAASVCAELLMHWQTLALLD
ncbi:xanthine dehydrogenase accessory protein XdhC [Massilia sp. W12]|uniref:xanthine dehydrogenase accessory protein XdhC n=1 Tax=Massilia sp. W12 TaxID=3126507 RepID=UPI0030D011AB